MSDWFYNVVWYACWPAFGVSSSPLVLHRERIQRDGPFILAANHLSPYDVPCLIKESSRHLDFVSILEVFRNPLMGWFYGNMNAFPLDRGRVDTGTTRIILDRLKKGRVVAMFPEGGVRREEDSVLNGGRMKPGALRLARLAGVPIVPAVILGTGAYRKLSGWLPLRRTRYAINFGEPLAPEPGIADEVLEPRLRSAFYSLHAELKDVLSHS